MEIAIALATGIASFIGSYSAIKIYVDYLRRDVDLAHQRIDQIQEGQRSRLPRSPKGHQLLLRLAGRTENSQRKVESCSCVV